MIQSRGTKCRAPLVPLLRKILSHLSSRDRKKLFLLSLIQVSLGFLDLLGVLGIGLLGSMSISKISGSSNTDATNKILTFLNLENETIQFQVGIVALISLFLLVARTVISIIFTRKILVFLSHRSAKVTASLATKLLSRSILDIKTRTYQENLFALTTGVQYLLIQVLATSLVIISDLSILLFIVLGLLVVDPILGILITTLFGLIGFILYKTMNGEAQRLGRLSSKLKITNSELIIESIRFYREAFVHNKTSKYIDDIENVNLKYAEISAKLNFMPYVSKYVIETAIIIGAVLVSAVQLFLHDITVAVTTLSLFLAAGTRIAPAVLRVQQGFVSIKGGVGQSEPTLVLMGELESDQELMADTSTEESGNLEFYPEIELKNVSLKYPGSEIYALNAVNIKISEGSQVAIVGPSGSGKSSLVDVILGILSPTSGEINISGVTPKKAIKKWPGMISYVPQDVYLAQGSIRKNLTLGYMEEEISEKMIYQALEHSDLNIFVNSLPSKIETRIGEDGATVSGGQKQRIGIARALITNPRLIVLDESTSSLDLTSEKEIVESLKKLRGRVTVLMIAHRLSTIKDADLVIYLENGEILSSGTLEQVKSEVDLFKKNAIQSGL